MESGAFACLGWPDAPGVYHRIISDSLCLAYAIDDMYDGDIDAWQDTCPLSDLLRAVPTFLATGDATSLPRDRPLFRAVIGLRERLVEHGASTQWLARFGGHFRGWLTAVGKEMQLKGASTVPTVEEMLDIRRSSGAVYVFADFIELAYRMNIPPRLWNDPELEELHRIAAKAIIYANDILSYARESLHGHSMNVLTAMCHYDGYTLGAAIHVLLKSHNRECSEMHRLARRIQATTDNSGVHRFVTRLQEFAHGLFEWGMHASRFSHELIVPASARTQSRPGIPIEIDPRAMTDSGAVAAI